MTVQFDFNDRVTFDSLNSRQPNIVTFTNVTSDIGLSGVTGNYFAWGDYNNDGYQDLLINGRRLFRNNGPPDWDFSEVTSQAGITGGNYGTWGDYDNDGWLDFYAPGSDILWHNNGDGTFSDVTSSAGNVRDGYPSVACGWGDYDRDGFIDLYIANYEDSDMNGFPDTFWHNNGDGTFTNATASAGIIESEPSRGVSWGDYNDDGWLDIYISNYRIRPNHLWENNGNGTFTNVAFDKGVEGDETVRMGTSYYGHTIGSAWSDYDNDGDLDLWSTNLAHKDLWRGPICDDSYMYRNDGASEGYNFTDVRQFTGIPTKNIGDGEDELMVGVAWGDYDNDGYQDLFLPQIYNDVAYAYSYLYHNDGDGTFSEVSNETGVRVWNTYGGAWADYNNDGWLDLVTGGKGGSDPNGTHEVHLYKNDGDTENNNWLQVTLKGSISNRAAIGSRITVSDGILSQMREVEGGMGSHSMQNSLTQHFGLRSYTGSVEISVRWPTGDETYYNNISINQHIEITETDIIQDVKVVSLGDPEGMYPVSGEVVGITWTITKKGVESSSTATLECWEHPESGDGSAVYERIELELKNATGIKFITSKWDTTGKKGNYTLTAELVDILPGDSNETNNYATFGTLNVRESNQAPVAVLEAYPKVAGLNEPVTFNANKSYDDIMDGIYYNFYYGDSMNSGWIESPIITHQYTIQGEYDTYVVMEDYNKARSNQDDPGSHQLITINTSHINHAPVIDEVKTDYSVVAPGEIVSISVNAHDDDGDLLTYVYQPSGGTIGGSGPDVIWFSPQEVGEYTITIYVTDNILESEHAIVKIIVTSTGENLPPEITSATASPVIIEPEETSMIEVVAFDPEGSTLLYIYSVDQGRISGSGYKVTYRGPEIEGTFQINIIVSDGEKDSLPFVVTVEVFENDAPVINDVSVSPESVRTGEKSTINVNAYDPDGDKLVYKYTPEHGSISGSGAVVSWTAPAFTGTFSIEITVTDLYGLEDRAAVTISSLSSPGPPDVINFDITPSVIGNDGTEAVTISAEIVDPNGLGDIETVLVDLSFIGGESDQKLYDNGRHGDEKAGDGVFMFYYEIPFNAPKGTWEIIVTVEDGEGFTATSNGLVIIENKVELGESSGFDFSGNSIIFILIIIVISIILIFLIFSLFTKPPQENY